MIETGLPKIRSIQSSHTEIKKLGDLKCTSALMIWKISTNICEPTVPLQRQQIYGWFPLNPTEGRSEPQYNNVCINAFNKRLQTVSGVTYINSHDYLVNKAIFNQRRCALYRTCNRDIYSYYLTSLWREETVCRIRVRLPKSLHSHWCVSSVRKKQVNEVMEKWRALLKCPPFVLPCAPLLI